MKRDAPNADEFDIYVNGESAFLITDDQRAVNEPMGCAVFTNRTLCFQPMTKNEIKSQIGEPNSPNLNAILT